MGTTQETKRLREQGFFTSGAVARELGISLNTLRRLEGTLFAPVARHGKRGLWIFTASQVEDLRKALREKTRLGPKPELVGIVEVARRAGCAVQTIRKRLGKELPRGRKLTQRPEPSRGEAGRGLGEATCLGNAAASYEGGDVVSELRAQVVASDGTLHWGLVLSES